MEVVHVHAVLDDVVTVFAGLAIGRARPDAAPGHPGREAARVMVAAEVDVGLVKTLAVVGASKLPTPDHERVVEHAAFGEILHERGSGLVGLPALADDALLEAAVVVPVLVIELDETDAPLGEPPGENAVGGERAGVPCIGAVLFDQVVRLVGEIGHLGHARLHPEGHLVVGDPGRDLGVGDPLKLMLVQLPQAVEQLAAVVGIDTRGIGDVEHGIAAGAKPDRLMTRGQEARAPEVRHQRLAALVVRDEYDERGKVVVGIAEAVVEPGTDARPPWDLRPALHEGHAGSVVDAFGVHRADEAEPVGDLRRVGQKLAQPGAGLTISGEPEGRADERDRTLVARHAGQPLPAPDALGQLFSALFDEQRLVVVEIELRRSARLKQINHPFRPGRKMEAAQHAAGPTGGCFGGGHRPAEHVGEREAAEPHAERAQPLPPLHQRHSHTITSSPGSRRSSSGR